MTGSLPSCKNMLVFTPIMTAFLWSYKNFILIFGLIKASFKFFSFTIYKMVNSKVNPGNCKYLILKRMGDQFNPPSCGFSKNVSSEERVKPWFFMSFSIIISHIFFWKFRLSSSSHSENMKTFSVNVSYFYQFSLSFGFFDISFLQRN